MFQSQMSTVAIGESYRLWIDGPEIEGEGLCSAVALMDGVRPMALFTIDKDDPIARFLTKQADVDPLRIAAVARYDLSIWQVRPLGGKAPLTLFAVRRYSVGPCLRYGDDLEGLGPGSLRQP